MDTLENFFQTLYRNFNERKINLVIENMTDNVKWANGMDGGYVYGQGEVKRYWARQFSLVRSNVTPLEIVAENNAVRIKVHQVVHDLEGKLLADEWVYHIFLLKNDKVQSFTLVKNKGTLIFLLVKTNCSAQVGTISLHLKYHR